MSIGAAAKKAARKEDRKAIDSALIQKMAAFLSLVLLIIFFSIASPFFFNYDNLITVIKQTAVIGIIAIGVTYVIITAGIDLSVGSVLAVSGVTTAVALRAGLPIMLSLFVGATVGTSCGLFSGFFVSKAGIPPFIATLGMMMTARGVSLVLTGGRPVYFMSNPIFKEIHNTDLFGFLPLPVIYLFLVSTLASFLLRRMSIGRYIYAVGSNEEAARISGINIVKTKLFVYGFSGLMSGLAGVLLTARLNSGQPSAGQMFELDAIASAVIGGTSLMGGEGTIVGTMIGAFIMSVLKNGLNLMNVSQFWQQVVIGLVVILAVYLDTLRKRK